MRTAREWALGLCLAGAALPGVGPWIGVVRAGELSTEALWGAGATGNRAACLRAGGRILEMPVAHVNPFGPGGDAAIAQPAAQPDETRSALCVFGAMGPGAASPSASSALAAPAWEVAAATDGWATGSIAVGPFGGGCGEECDASLTLLSDRDREALIALPERMRETLLAVPDDASEDGGTRVAREAATTLAAEADEAAEPERLAAPLDLSSGEVDCTWRVFEARAVRVEPTGRCRVGRDGTGAPTLSEMADRGLAVRLEPLTDRYSVYLDQRSGDATAEPGVGDGRTGLATRLGNQVHLVEASGTAGFAVLTLSGN